MKIKLLMSFSLGAICGATALYKFGAHLVSKEAAIAITYMGKMMKEHGVIPTEYDLIALRDMAKYYPKDDNDKIEENNASE